jgi:hypothetical protein
LKFGEEMEVVFEGRKDRGAEFGVAGEETFHRVQGTGCRVQGAGELRSG